MLTRKVFLPLAAVALVGASAIGIQTANAASTPSSQAQSLVQDIAHTFNLDPAKVQAVFNEHSQAKQAAIQARYQDMLQKAVTNGKLTQSQMSAILTEHNALVAQLQAAKAETGQTRQTDIRTVSHDAQTWASQNHVSVKWLLGPRHMRAAVPPNQSPSISPTPSS